MNDWLETCKQQTIIYDEHGNHSTWYALPDSQLIIDSFHFPSTDGRLQVFDYRSYTAFQNKVMATAKPVYRFLLEDSADVSAWLQGTIDFPQTYKISSDRSLSVADSSSLEHFFEERFCTVYGSNALSYLHREYPVPGRNGSTYYVDYLVEYHDGRKVAVEENGVAYHHPLIIGKQAYRTQLDKQNTCSYLGIRLFRFTTLDCSHPAIVDDQIRHFFGDARFFRPSGFAVERSFQLYEHQEEALQAIQQLRSTSNPPHAVLQVFPTATGKSRIVEEDLTIYLTQYPNAKVLIVAPTIRIVEDWRRRITGFTAEIIVGTYYLLWYYASKVPPTYFSYIVVDEAHHAAAPTIRRSLQYFQSEFLIGLTATPDRLDKKRLEEIFGSYQTSLTLADAIEKGIIAPIRAFRVETNLNLAEVRFNGRDYINADLERALRVDSRDSLIVDVLLRYFASGQKGIIFCISVAHAQHMEKLLVDCGMKAKAITGKTRNVSTIIEEFRFSDLQFLCSCNLVNEGWDVPEVEVLVMARPTISKVLYQQQLGRGLRKCEDKECLFVIDVVDQYGSLARPWSVHAIFSQPCYTPFGLLNRTYQVGEMVEVLGLSETVQALIPVDITTFERQYEGYLDEEQAARNLYIGTETLRTWVKQGSVSADLSLPLGKRWIYYFKPESLEYIRQSKGLGVHTDETLKDDFIAFLKEKNYTFSFKMVFMLSMFKHCNMHGEASIDVVMEDYRRFYLNRLASQLPVDRERCMYTEEFLSDKVAVKRNMLTNPFEKFERKRFVHYVKDLNLIGFNPILYASLSEQDINECTTLLTKHLKEYYQNLGGLPDELL